MKKNFFSKANANGLKGIAVILMVAHHLFWSKSLYEGYEIVFAPFNEDFINKLSAYFKLCVGVFAFITGYGLAKSYKAESKSYSRLFLKRYLKTFIPFWIIYIIVAAVSQITDKLVTSVYFPEGTGIFKGILYMLLDFFGLFTFTQTPTLCVEWWYMGAYILFLLLTPLFVFLTKKFGGIIPVVGLMLLSRMLNIGFIGGIKPYSFLMALLLGVIFEHYNGFAILNTWTVPITKNKHVREICTFILYFGALVLSYYYFTLIETHLLWEVSFGVVPVVFIVFFNRYVMRFKWIAKAFSFVGEYSAGIYLIHMIVKRYTSELLYCMPNFILSVVALFAMSFAASVILELAKRLVRFNKFEEYIFEKLN